MTLNEYIESLVQLRDHYQAGDFNVRLQKSLKTKCMDGDDFCLNMHTKELEIGDRAVIPEDDYSNRHNFQWIIMEDDENGEPIREAYRFNEVSAYDIKGYKTFQNALNTAKEFMKDNDEFATGRWEIDIFDGEDYVGGEEMIDGVFTNYNNETED